MRSAFNSLIIALLTVIFGLIACVAWLFDRSGDGVIEVSRAWARALRRTTGMRVRVRTEAAIDPTRPCVFVSNHLSAADIWALYAVLPVPVRMIAKKQLGWIPFLGWAMHAGRFIFIDRGNAAAARRSIDRAAERIREGCSVLLFAEGTRSRDGRMQAFKKGGFHLAMKAGVPIVPVAVKGTWEILPPDTLFVRAGEVDVVIGQPVETHGVPEAELAALVERVRATIAHAIGDEGKAQPRADAVGGQ